MTLSTDIIRIHFTIFAPPLHDNFKVLLLFGIVF